LTLVALETRREWDGMTVTADDGRSTRSRASSATRSAIPICSGATETGVLSLVLLDAD